MSPKTTPRDLPARDAPASSAPRNWAADLANQQFALGTEGGAVLMRGLEAMRRIQEQAAGEALRRHADATRKLGAARQPAQALALQSELLHADLEEAARCWRDLVGEAFEMGSEWAACATRLVNSEDVFAAMRPFHVHG